MNEKQIETLEKVNAASNALAEVLKDFLKMNTLMQTREAFDFLRALRDLKKEAALTILENGYLWDTDQPTG